MLKEYSRRKYYCYQNQNAIKMRNNFGYPLKNVIFQYYDSNIGLFSIAPHLVIALPTIATAIVVALLCS
jgi:hypothetical protein